MSYFVSNRSSRVESVFPCLDDEIQLEPIMLGTKEVSYDRRVKISDWQNRYLMEPRDNIEFFPPKGHLRMATYKRLGTHSPPIYLSETKDKIREYKSCDFDKCSQPVKLLNIFSFPLTDIDEKNKLENEIKCTPENMPEIIPEELPETLYRRTLGYSLEDLERLRGMRTFLDDDLEIHKKISDLRIKQYNR